MTASVLALCLFLIDEPDDQEKFQYLFEKYEEDAIKAAYSILREYALAEDASQETFIRIARVIKRIDLNNNPRSFIITVAQNVAKDIVKKYSRESISYDVYNTFYEAEKVTPCKEIEEREYIERLSRYVKSLSPIYSQVFVMRYVHRMEYGDISKALGVKEPALRKRMQRLKKMMFDFLEKETRNNGK